MEKLIDNAGMKDIWNTGLDFSMRWYELASTVSDAHFVAMQKAATEGTARFFEAGRELHSAADGAVKSFADLARKSCLS